MAFAPAVFAQPLSDNPSGAQAGQVDQTAQADDYNKTSGVGFENVESDGGTMLVGTARVPKADGNFATVKFIYSSGINLNEKSLNLINTELNACGVTVSGSMVYVSRSDLVSDSTLVAETSERQAVFACGSEANPTVLTAYPAYESVEESFEYLYRGYVYSISEYNSLSGVFSGRDEIKLSDDGKSAYTSIVMEEDYVDKVINGKTVKILMINSELKYCFRAPKLIYVKDESYNVASNSDIQYHYGSTTADTSQTTTAATTPSVTSSSVSSTTSSSAPSDEMIVTPDNQSTTTASQATSTATPQSDNPQGTTTVNVWDYLTTTSQPKITAGASPIVTSVTQSTTITTASSASTDSKSTSTSAPSSTTSSVPATSSTTVKNQGSATATLPAVTTRSRQNSAVLPNVTNDESQNSQRGTVSTRRLPLNVRSGPGMKYMVVTVLPKGTYVTVLDTSNPDWYMIKTMGKVVGYAYSRYIRIM